MGYAVFGSIVGPDYCGMVWPAVLVARGNVRSSASLSICMCVTGVFMARKGAWVSWLT